MLGYMRVNWGLHVLSFRELVATELASVKGKVCLEDAVPGRRGPSIYRDAQNVWNICWREANILARWVSQGEYASNEGNTYRAVLVGSAVGVEA